MTMRTARPKAIAMWAVAVSGKWFDGVMFMHDGEKPWLFGTKEAATAKAIECTHYRRERDFAPAIYKPVRVTIALVPARRKPA